MVWRLNDSPQRLSRCRNNATCEKTDIYTKRLRRYRTRIVTKVRHLRSRIFLIQHTLDYRQPLWLSPSRHDMTALQWGVRAVGLPLRGEVGRGLQLLARGNNVTHLAFEADVLVAYLLQREHKCLVVPERVDAIPTLVIHVIFNYIKSLNKLVVDIKRC